MAKPPKLTPKQEAFVKCISQGMTQSDAYRSAYDAEKMADKSIWEKASVLAANGKVAARLFLLQEAAFESNLVSIESITVELEEARQLAKKTKQSNAMTSASMGKAKVNGLLIEKQEVKHFNITISDDDAKL